MSAPAAALDRLVSALSLHLLTIQIRESTAASIPAVPATAGTALLADVCCTGRTGCTQGFAGIFSYEVDLASDAAVGTTEQKMSLGSGVYLWKLEIVGGTFRVLSEERVSDCLGKIQFSPRLPNENIANEFGSFGAVLTPICRTRKASRKSHASYGRR